MLEPIIDLFFEKLINILHLKCIFLLKIIEYFFQFIIKLLHNILIFPPFYLWIFFIAYIGWKIINRTFAVFSSLGLTIIAYMDLWSQAISSVSLTLTATFIAIMFSIPIGILASRYYFFSKIIRPILDLMQTMPVFIYLIPVVLIFGLGPIPSVIATLIFAMPPTIRLTELGIRNVSQDITEAAIAFGATPIQLLLKVQIPIALPTIMTGINQTLMMALSMIVIGGMIGAGGLGQEVLRGIQRLEIGAGFEAGFAVVIIAMILDRLTQSLVRKNKISKY